MHGFFENYWCRSLNQVGYFGLRSISTQLNCKIAGITAPMQFLLFNFHTYSEMMIISKVLWRSLRDISWTCWMCYSIKIYLFYRLYRYRLWKRFTKGYFMSAPWEPVSGLCWSPKLYAGIGRQANYYLVLRSGTKLFVFYRLFGWGSYALIEVQRYLDDFNGIVASSLLSSYCC